MSSCRLAWEAADEIFVLSADMAAAAGAGEGEEVDVDGVEIEVVEFDEFEVEGVEFEQVKFEEAEAWPFLTARVLRSNPGGHPSAPDTHSASLQPSLTKGKHHVGLTKEGRTVGDRDKSGPPHAHTHTPSPIAFTPDSPFIPPSRQH